jgi:hypothetical protein
MKVAYFVADDLNEVMSRKRPIFLIPFYLQAVHVLVHLANGVKLIKA